MCAGGDVSTAPLIKDVPIWAFHGAKDEVVPPHYSRDMIAAIREAGGLPGYTEYPDVAHDSWIPAYNDSYMLEWLFSQVRDGGRSEEHTSELQSRGHLVCRLLL